MGVKQNRLQRMTREVPSSETVKKNGRAIQVYNGFLLGFRFQPAIYMRGQGGDRRPAHWTEEKMKSPWQ